MEDKILKLFGQPDYTPINISQLMRRLKLAPNDKPEVEKRLARLEREGRIARIKGNRFILPQEADLIPGRIRINRQGKGFLEADDPKLPTIVVPEHATGTAFNNDRVLVRRDVRYRGRSRIFQEEETGKVIRILERERTQLVGTFQSSNRFLYVIPDDPRIPHDIYVTEPRDVGRRPNLGDKVVVELKLWESRELNPEGEIIEVLGAPDEEGVDMLSVLRQYNLPLHFPKTVLQEAHAIGNQIDERDIAGREDCRAHTVVTIDPVDAKDFDDAICLEAAPNGHWKLWVHIADVSHYVKVGSALDEEAQKRGNSTYLVDRVIPMLPEALSNELCSLKPGVERLTKCVEFLLSAEGKVIRSRFYPAVIHSKRRFTYEEVLEALQRKPAGPIEEMLHHANTMAQRLRRARMQAGSLDLDFPESKIRLDEQGKILRIDRVENDISHQLIEEYMLLANEAVAGKLMALDRQTVYRIHEPPDDKRLQEFREDVLSHQIQCGNLTNRHEVQKLLQKLNSLPIGPALKIGFLKSLMRARYAVEPLGHYGLAKAKYTHFTSPIRRYADLVVHRSLFQKGREKVAAESLRNVAEHISDTERNSADAERDSKDVKLFAYLQSQLDSGRPQRYPGLVTDVRNFGFFVDVPGLGMSGVVPLSTLPDDFFQFDSNRNQLIGRRSRRVFKLGDKVEVQIHKVDKFKKQVDFRLAGPERKELPRKEVPKYERPKPQIQRLERPQFKLSYSSRRAKRR
ncbi:ribonuclease R [Pedosphaera parvula]|uniref:Ribonuclease R n=1 Tax=Pedosphaera parvula (strain Ellin514) TaxID=320771 RepID=B9XG02_PEDPL|nr:ribonuclease R [Pedosphaera parvula]EEF61164.1 ribonuclease R [Pedosphaera parvula Ellin514]